MRGLDDAAFDENLHRRCSVASSRMHLKFLDVETVLRHFVDEGEHFVAERRTPIEQLIENISDIHIPKT